jgi:predicted DNA-binding transcriptional regulator YafY
MKKVEIADERARKFSEVSPYKNFFDSADYSGKIFNMFSGDTQTFEASCHSSILEEIVDRFGSDTTMRVGSDEDRFFMSTKCVISEGLVSWIMQFGDRIEVLEPKSLRDQVKKRAEEISDLYK